VLIVADDLGYGDVGCYGSRDILSPHIDALASQGVRFTDGYVTAAVCSPSRAGLISGRYQQRNGYEYNWGGRPSFGLSTGETTLASLLKISGYATCAIGKWHLGSAEPYFPLSRGFDEFYGFINGGKYATPRTPGIVTFPSNAKIHDRRFLYRGKDLVSEDAYLTDAFTREAIDFIHRHKDAPFFLYLAHKAPHTPLTAKREDYRRNSHIDTRRRRVYAAMISALDDGVGQIASTLRALGLEKDTLVVFLSDNGGAYWAAASNDPLNGGKRFHYEGGIRVPFIMRWPGHLPAGTVYREPVTSLDLYPTFAAASGAVEGVRTDHDGVDILPYLSGNAAGTPHERLFWRTGPNRAVRQGKWKLWQVDRASPEAPATSPAAVPVAQKMPSSPHGREILLFDLSTDVGESTNVAEAHPDVVKQLLQALDQWESELMDPAWSGRMTIFERNGMPLQLFF